MQKFQNKGWNQNMDRNSMRGKHLIEILRTARKQHGTPRVLGRV